LTAGPGAAGHDLLGRPIGPLPSPPGAGRAALALAARLGFDATDAGLIASLLERPVAARCHGFANGCGCPACARPRAMSRPRRIRQPWDPPERAA
jgi:hypothetical protein